ncbi:hypothetical protein BC938DRAFT_479360 [Jimgerdemannia flammicorona]|uniref:Ubiquitin-like domain-containing protein n=1 Tax=Jimgerdemannia flammicorona TaxID=994334 RepID=A0A433QL14_9FUNG|nr:hypothetical protein BC938DRAFT_479360 [Jimgerdemannia flammicorona]
MRCTRCSTDKLSIEFPQSPITDACEHIPTNCLRCLSARFKASSVVPGYTGKTCPECHMPLSDRDWIRFMEAIQDSDFVVDMAKIGVVTGARGVSPSIASHSTAGPLASYLGSVNNLPSSMDGVFYVVLLTGENFSFSLNAIRSVQALKIALQTKTKVEPLKQKLIFEGKDLDEYPQNSLAAYGIGSGSYVQLIIVLYAITPTSKIRNVIFRLYWGYPAHGADYLDGTCLVFQNPPKETVLFDFGHREQPSLPYIHHSGDIMRPTQGHHEIIADLANLPQDVQHLYFVLSAWKSPTIGHFPNPSFQMFDREKPTKQLCQYCIGKAANSQAVILCCVSRTRQGWEVKVDGRLSAGNASNYPPIINTIGINVNAPLISNANAPFILMLTSH